MSDTWVTSFRSLAGSLLTLEVNTIEKQNMTATKLPEAPLALHQIAGEYEAFLAEDQCYVTEELMGLIGKWLNPGSAEQDLNNLVNWQLSWNPGSAQHPYTELKNGPATFEALRWVARAALRAPTSGSGPMEPAHRSLLIRIENNCRILRQLTLALQQQNTHLGDVRAEALFNGTLEQTLEQMFAHPRPNITVDSDMLVHIRKIWDIGLETVLFQTVMQVDGDTVVRMAPNLDEARRAFYSDLHRSSAQTALSQWRSLFELASLLVGNVGQSLFGPSRKA